MLNLISLCFLVSLRATCVFQVPNWWFGVVVRDPTTTSRESDAVQCFAACGSGKSNTQHLQQKAGIPCVHLLDKSLRKHIKVDQKGPPETLLKIQKGPSPPKLEPIPFEQARLVFGTLGCVFGR